MGYSEASKKYAAAALALSNSRDVSYLAAQGLAFAGDTARAESLADALAKMSATDTLINSIYIPTVRAQIALNGRDAQKAIDELAVAEQYELGQTGTSNIIPAAYPPYIRGEAYLALKQGASGGGISEDHRSCRRGGEQSERDYGVPGARASLCGDGR
jgi:hypothetical protein